MVCNLSLRVVTGHICGHCDLNEVFLNEKVKFLENFKISRDEWMEKENCKERLEAATKTNILYLYGQEKCIFTSRGIEKSGTIER